ncbi:unnamed protein product [Linum tenue]|uniref:Cyanobacterial aminoacyl-tRNA synthetase CAAD domain-containing protein n=1 Tax=Linum tenue TaxID=586396 RepID=A0AAV0KNB4_9ROSI|nr:unnamed protein product [Linum tenue]
MASVIASLPPLPSLLLRGRQSIFVAAQPLPASPMNGKHNRAAVISKATGESSDSSLNIAKSVQSVWDKSEDRVAVIGLGFAAIVALWASASLVAVITPFSVLKVFVSLVLLVHDHIKDLEALAIDKLPVFPSLLEVVGILYSTWFVYRYLLFKPNREELVEIINKSVSEILGQ